MRSPKLSPSNTLKSLRWLRSTVHMVWNILGIWQLYRHLAASGKHSIQAGDGSGITTLAQLDPEHDQAGMLIWVVVGSV